MKIKRYSAPDMRTALRMVQQEQGPDAVILSSHESSHGIELVAAVDYDEALMQQARSRAKSRDEVEVSPQMAEFDDSRIPQGSSVLEQQIEAMREMLESRLDAVSTQYHSRSPGRRSAHALLGSLGIRAAHAHRLAEALDASVDGPRARRQIVNLLAQELPLGRKELMSHGGALALVGPTGVGKTTTVAKLAARHILQFGQGSVQLVSTDEYRIGAREQLAAFGRILGAPLHRISRADELDDLLGSRQKEELILVDTAGIGGRDTMLQQQFALLSRRRGLFRALCQSAATSVPDLTLQARRFADARPNCLILTKLDETGQIGAMLSYLLDQKLPLAYISDGQQVPEDLHMPRAADLIGRALQARKLKSGEELRACA